MLLNPQIVFPGSVKSHSNDTSPRFRATFLCLRLQLLNTSELVNKVVILIPKSFPNSCKLSALWRVKAFVKIQTSVKLVDQGQRSSKPCLSTAEDKQCCETCGIPKSGTAYLCICCLSPGQILLVINLL